MRTAVIVASCESYRVADFVKAAAALRIELVVATDAELPLAGGVRHLEVDLALPDGAAAKIAVEVPEAGAVVAIEDEGVEVAAAASALLQLPHSRPAGVAATRNKLVMRSLLAAGGVPQPDYGVAASGELGATAAAVGYPVVVKPLGLTASRGVIRLDGAQRVEQVEQRIRRILVDAGENPDEVLLVEGYVPGREMVIEGVLHEGELVVLAAIDKPDPLEGPFFEETLFVTPSRWSSETQEGAIEAVRLALRALGMVAGPIHAEVRLTPDDEIRVLEVAARSIGGLCGRSLTFGLLGESLEVVVLRAAFGDSIGNPQPARASSGVLMLPIPASGVLTGVEGVEQVKGHGGIDDVQITIPIGRKVLALPEGDRYLGFVFASGATPEEVEAALRGAASELAVTIDGEALESSGLSLLV